MAGKDLTPGAADKPPGAPPPASPRIVTNAQARAKRVAWNLGMRTPRVLGVRPLTPTQRDSLDAAEKRYSRDLKEFNERKGAPPIKDAGKVTP